MEIAGRSVLQMMKHPVKRCLVKQTSFRSTDKAKGLEKADLAEPKRAADTVIDLA